MDIKYTSIILSKRDIAEVDRLYNIFTLEAGKVQIVGKGVRKPNAKLAGCLEPITESEVFISRTRGRGNITGAIATNNFAALKDNFNALSRVFSAISHFNNLITQEEKDEDIYYLLRSYLEAMDALGGDEKAELKAEIISRGFIFKLMAHLGYTLVVDACAGCGERIAAGNNYFSAQRGGVLCEKCAKLEGGKIRINDATIKLIRIFLANKLENFSKLDVPKNDINNLKAVSEEMINWIRA